MLNEYEEQKEKTNHLKIAQNAQNGADTFGHDNKNETMEFRRTRWPEYDFTLFDVVIL